MKIVFDTETYRCTKIRNGLHKPPKKRGRGVSIHILRVYQNLIGIIQNMHVPEWLAILTEKIGLDDIQAHLSDWIQSALALP